MSNFNKETEAQEEYTANGIHISCTKRWKCVFVAVPRCTLVPFVPGHAILGNVDARRNLLWGLAS